MESFIDPSTNLIYYKLKILGKGGFAKVYKCRRGEPYSRSDPEVALKVIPKTRIAKPSQRDKIDAEIQIQKSLDHPHIVKLVDHFEDQIKICLVLELCERKSLTSLLKQHGQVPQSEASHIMKEITQALQYIHSKGIVHRDLKLGNILLDQTGVSKLGDFGLAMYYKEATPGNICGTPNFIAPEVLNDHVHDPASDIWALGCVIFTLLSGKPAFEYTTMRDTYKRIVKLQYKIPDQLTPAARDLISSILVKDPRRRPTHRHILGHEFITGIKMMPKFRSRTLSTENALQPVTNTRRLSSTSEDNFSVNKRKHSIGESGINNRRRTFMPGDNYRQPPPSNPSANSSFIPFHGQHRNDRSHFGHPGRLPIPNSQTNRERGIPETTETNTGNKENNYSNIFNESEIAGILSPTQSRDQYNQNIMDQYKVVWINKWVDYTNRLGFGYELSDGKIGVLLHANSYIVLQRDGITVDDWSQTNNRQARFAIGEAPRSAQRHLKILQYFVDYISQKLCDGAVNSYTLSTEVAMQTAHVRLTKWKSYDQGFNAMGMLLNNDTLQVNFISDSVKIVVHSPFITSTSVVILISPNRKLEVYTTSTLELFPPSQRARLSIVHSILHDLHSDFPCCPSQSISQLGGGPRSVLCELNFNS